MIQCLRLTEPIYAVPNSILFTNAMQILDYLEVATINFSLRGPDKEAVLDELIEILRQARKITQVAPLRAALLEREGLGSTGIGHGVAIPHARSNELKGPIIALGRTKAEVDFDAIDGQPTRLFFLLVAPQDGGNEHLFTLAKIAKLIKDARVREQLMTLESADEVVALIRTWEAPDSQEPSQQQSS